jgi:hypothetical protein
VLDGLTEVTISIYLGVMREGGLDVRRGLLPALVVPEHDRGAEFEVPIVDPVGVDEHDPLIGEATTDLSPREALGGRGAVGHGLHHAH